MIRRRLTALAAVACAALAVFDFAAASSPAQAPATAQVAGSVSRGRALFVDGCSNCHGLDARGVRGVAPSLRGVGEQAADFYLSTGRMPLAAPREQPERSQPAYSAGEIRDLVAYVGSYGGPGLPVVAPAQGSLSEGQRLFADSCAGCHQILARGGIVTGARVPNLDKATPRQIAEAIRIGPYAMPRFSDRQLTSGEVDSIARYVAYARRPDDRGGWAIGHIGPIPEGMVAWLLGLAALVLTIRLIGERTTG